MSSHDNSFEKRGETLFTFPTFFQNTRKNFKIKLKMRSEKDFGRNSAKLPFLFSQKGTFRKKWENPNRFPTSAKEVSEKD
ncbi:MAG: hypothetical protein Q4D62_08870 [Planctomycetia bacterium]|nr:hypothetical protein [Planctomycetia bacterium]